MTVRGVGELGLIERIKPYLDAQSGRDDAAIIPEAAGYSVASCDLFVEGVHFDLSWMSAADAGWRSLALALGDLAAKGADPRWALVSLAIPDGWTVETVTGLYEGMAGLAAAFDLALVGGDLSAIAGPAALSITVVGHTESRPLARAEAQPGWEVGVTGALGGAAVALRAHRPHRLVPLIDEGRRLNHLGLCCGDISDGLVRELEKFETMAGAGAVIQAGEVPIAAGASLEEALTSGEEAELVCVGPPGRLKEAGVRAVGRLTTEATIRVVDRAGRPVAITRRGYDHFA